MIWGSCCLLVKSIAAVLSLCSVSPVSPIIRGRGFVRAILVSPSAEDQDSERGGEANIGSLGTYELHFSSHADDDYEDLAC